MNRAEYQTHLRIFVYGTLKRGFWNHDNYCSRAINIVPATAWGKLYHLPEGYPALEVPENSMLAYGTSDPLIDTRTQNTLRLPDNAMEHPEGDWDQVHGELMTLTNPTIELPPIDRLEEFNPNGHSMYQRVLVAVNAQNVLYACWTYHGLKHILQGSVRLFNGYWDGKKYG